MMRTALITGASGGIGRAVARRLARAGYSLALSGYTHTDPLRTLAVELNSEFGVRAAVFSADMADGTAVRQMCCAAEDFLSGIGVLVSAAGIAHTGLLPSMTDSEWERVIGVNLSGTAHACRAVLPGMIRRHDGAIVTVSSIWGEVGASCEVAYSAAKAGVIGLTRALAKEVAPSGIRVNCVSPGVIRTPMLDGYSESDLRALAEETPLGRLGTPEEVAEAVQYLAEASFVTGQVLGVNGGFVI